MRRSKEDLAVLRPICETVFRQHEDASDRDVVSIIKTRAKKQISHSTVNLWRKEFALRGTLCGQKNGPSAKDHLVQNAVETAQCKKDVKSDKDGLDELESKREELNRQCSELYRHRTPESTKRHWSLAEERQKVLHVIDDANRAIETDEKRLEDLRKDRERIEIDVTREDLDAVEAAIVPLAMKIDAAGTEILKDCGDWISLGLRRHILRGELGMSRGRTPKSRYHDAIVSIFGRLAPHEFGRPSVRGATFVTYSKRHTSSDDDYGNGMDETMVEDNDREIENDNDREIVDNVEAIEA